MLSMCAVSSGCGLPNGRELMSLGEDAEAYLWDVGTRRCVHWWKDDGGFRSRVSPAIAQGVMLQLGGSVSPAFYLGVISRTTENCRCFVTLMTQVEIRDR